MSDGTKACEIPLPSGGPAYVSPDNFEWASQFNWNRTARGYVRRIVRSECGKRGYRYMHREVVARREPLREGLEVDHVDSCKHNNTSENLRQVTHTQNMANTKKYRTNTTGFIGIWVNKRTGSFETNLWVDNRKLTFGCYRDRLDAAMAYDIGSTYCCGEFGRVNFSEYAPIYKELVAEHGRLYDIHSRAHATRHIVEILKERLRPQITISPSRQVVSLGV